MDGWCRNWDDGLNALKLTHHIFLYYFGLREALRHHTTEPGRVLCHPRLAYIAGVPSEAVIIH
jgi:hypothetical protein